MGKSFRLSGKQEKAPRNVGQVITGGAVGNGGDNYTVQFLCPVNSLFQGLIVGAPPIEWLHVLGLSQNSHQRQLIHKSAAKSNTESRTDRSGHFSTTGSPDENTCASVFLAQLLERFSRRTIPFHRRFLVLQSPANRAKTQGSLITTQIARGN